MSKRIIIIVAVLLAATGLFLRHYNSQEASRRAAALMAADTAGQDTAIAARELKDYVAGHMGAKADVNLAASYARAEAAAKDAAAAQTANSQIYADAQRICGGKSDSVTQAKCQQDYLTKHLANVPLPTPVAPPQLADYQFKLQAPLWTPDLAGAAFLGAAAAAALLLFNALRRRFHG